MLIVVIVIGLLYALPNLFGEDPAVQITGARGVAASEQTLIQVQKTLQEEKITAKSVALEEGAILARFDSTDTQLRAREALMGVMGDKYVVALNLAPATPRWLAAIHAEPMKLGLDLRGGVHFLMEVDMDTALGKLQEQNIDSLRSDLREKGIPYTTVRKENNYGLSITFRDAKARDEAIAYLSKRHPDLVISSQGSNQLRAVMSDARLSEAREYAVQQNINILRNRVNQLGVAEPVVQRQGADRIVVELPGIQDTARAKGVKYLFETNVGAGLPIINTINDLTGSGDKILCIEAVLSGTRNFVFNEVSKETSFSKAVQMAREAGYSEPDPRIDLSGKDVMRKLVILAREAGYRVDIEDVIATPFIPEEFMNMPLDEFLERLPELDADFEAKRMRLEQEGKRWRYVARLDNGKTSVGLVAVDKNHPFFHLEGSNNVILITTERYREYPMHIEGYGAGADVTAAGVFADIMSVANI